MNPESFTRRIHVLLVEDNPADARLIQEILKDNKFSKNISVVGDGEEALTYLYQQGRHRNAVRPDLILLDLNLPKKNGRAMLEQVKTNPELKRIPVVIFTSSEAEADILGAYDLHVNCYITKPIRLEQFSMVLKSIENFWFGIVQLPKND